VRRRWFNNPALRVLAIVVLFAGAGFHESVRQNCLNNITNGDFWWHLRVGLGILQSHAVPHSGLYSQAAALPWMDSSWFYDLLVATGYRVLDLRFLPLLAIACKVALAVVTFILAGGSRGRFWTAVALSAATQYILTSLQPLPVFCSILAFGVELTLLLECRRTGSVRPLYWVPLLFLLWANLHWQFVGGIAVLLLFVATCLVEQWGMRAGISWLERPANPPLKALGAVTAASLIATVITPYGWNIYGLFFSQATSAANRYFPDYQALRFRSPQDYLLLLLTMAAFLALGMRRSRDVFQIALLVVCTAFSFHVQRDVWLVTLAAVAILANPIQETRSQTERDTIQGSALQLLAASGLAVLLLVAATMIHLPQSREAMLAKIGQEYPVGAADYIREHHLPQPLFNSFPWGGFLTWYLPEYPVAIDGRTDLYGADFNIQYAKAMNAEVHYSTFPALNQAGTLLLEKNSLMGTALANVPAFKVAYSDDVAIVLVREPGS
jgi:hypothetical protein